MEETWDLEFLSQFLDYLMSFGSEFLDDWRSNDMRVSIFKIILGWLVFSLLAIHVAWSVYGSTVNFMYYRQGISLNKIYSGRKEEERMSEVSEMVQEIGREQEPVVESMGGQNGGTPDVSSNFAGWDSPSPESAKTHRE